VVLYRADDGSTTQFEIDPLPGYAPAAAAGEVIASVRDAVSPAIAAAKVVLDRLNELGSESVEVRFGVKVSGRDNWAVARRAEEGNFEVTLSWRP